MLNRSARALKKAHIRKVLLRYMLDREDLPLCEIASREGIRLETAYKIIREVKAEWARENAELRDQVCDRILQGILATRRLANEMLAASREAKTVETKGMSGGKPFATVQTIKQHGDAALVAQINKTYELEAKLLGVNAPEKHHHLHEFGRQAIQAFTEIGLAARKYIAPERWPEWREEAIKIRRMFDPDSKIRDRAAEKAREN